jgi:hypothetical protein
MILLAQQVDPDTDIVNPNQSRNPDIHSLSFAGRSKCASRLSLIELPQHDKQAAKHQRNHG